MDLTTLTRERRRSPRLLRELPVVLHLGDRVLDLRSVEISAHGARFSSPRSPVVGLGVLLENPRTGKRVSGWVVRCATGYQPGTFELAVEFLEPSPGFWGADYAPSLQA